MFLSKGLTFAALLSATSLLSSATAAEEDDSFFFGSCDRCLLFLRQVHKIGSDGSCQDRCVLFEGRFLRDGWKCGECPDTVEETFETTLDLVDAAPQFHPAFESAAARWSDIIVGDLEDVEVDQETKDESDCTRLPDVIDDVFICAKVAPIDGPSNILGFAGPEFARFGDTVTPFIGQMVFDSADVQFLVNQGTFDEVILHEIGHVFGVGTLWLFNDLLGLDECSYKKATKASAEYQALSGCDAAIPMETDGGGGTACGHWDEECFQDELMTGFATGSLPLSRLTVATLDDMGYKVNYNSADAFSVDQLNSNCVCNNRRNNIRRVLEKTQKRKLSAEGRAEAVNWGQDYLQKKRGAQGFSSKSSRGGSGATKKVGFVGDQSIVVFYMEQGKVFDVFVKAEN